MACPFAEEAAMTVLPNSESAMSYDFEFEAGTGRKKMCTRAKAWGWYKKVCFSIASALFYADIHSGTTTRLSLSLMSSSAVVSIL